MYHNSELFLNKNTTDMRPCVPVDVPHKDYKQMRIFMVWLDVDFYLCSGSEGISDEFIVLILAFV